MTKAVWGVRIRLAGVLTLIVLSSSCGDVTRQGTASTFLIVRSLTADGASVLNSDVLTVVGGAPTILDDAGSVTFGLGLKDPGSANSPNVPTQNNWITVNRYHVTFVRTDGRNTPGVDVPYAFDGAFTALVSGDTSVGFTWVRHQAKGEAPLAALARNGLVISTIAQITFYGHDQTGREVSATGQMSINFANFGDSQ